MTIVIYLQLYHKILLNYAENYQPFTSKIYIFPSFFYNRYLCSMSQHTLFLLEKEKQDFALAFDQLQQQFQSTSSILQAYYEQAYNNLEGGKFIFNTSIIKELKMYLSQITKIASLAGNGVRLFLLSINAEPHEQSDEDLDIDKFIEKYRDKNEIPLKKWLLQDKHLNRLKNRCGNVISLSLLSNPYKLQEMINEADLSKIKLFNKISRLSIKGSNVSDSGLDKISEYFQNLKQIDVSGCRMISNQGIKKLSGYKYVGVKLNGCEGISQKAITTLISTSYNINYLEISNISTCNYKEILQEINEIYYKNKTNFKWLQIVCNLGTMLFVNKLAYLTHLTNAEIITDRQIEILLGDQPSIDGLYFNCCEQLHSDTIKYIITNCTKLKRLSLRRFLNLTDALVGDVVSSLVKLQYLNLSQCFSLTNRAIIQVANQLRKLKQINLSKCINICDEQIIYLVEKMPTITHINLSGCKNITDKSIYHICNSLPGLLSLNLSKCEQITNESLVYISQKLLQIQELILNFCDHINDESITLIAMRQRKLRRLQLQWCQVSQKCISFIAENLNQLQIINFNFCPTVMDQSFTSLAKRANKLHTLKLQSCDKLSTKAFVKLFQSLKKIKYLDLNECIGVSDLAIQQVCNSSRGQLIHLDISWCSKITDKGILSLSQFQPQILYLNLNGCSALTDSAITWLCSSMTHLQYFNITLCENLTDKSVLEISKSLHSLRNLYLCDLKKITDVSVSSLASIPNLEELHLSGCLRISSSSLIALLHNLEKLQCLNISQCSNIFAQSLLLLVERMRNLKRFSVASLNIEDKLLQMAGEYMQKLQIINLEYCRSISDKGVLRLMERVPSLLRIELQNTQISQKTKQAIFQQLSSRSNHLLLDD